ncbi:DUF2334 domain-containing protein [Nonlabens mediterrranea]|uniref:DUF2334 domain-containing protein n=1 Tax=Nonlabens mediterrranea TaxID=1419947 RepID=A0ABS0A2R5_9FLAO|nr:DUF2334 domain-containing protein [Nonlabens mediterrranea]
MNVNRAILISFLFTTLFSCSSILKSNETRSKQYVILKLDDLWNEEDLVHNGWIEVINFLNQENIKGTIGIVGNSLETDDNEYFQWIKTRNNEGHEIWNHGFCHCKRLEGEIDIREYRGEGLEEQFESIFKTQNLAKEKLNITLRSFGAPYNSTDKNTIVALEKIPEIKVWLFKENSSQTEKFVINRINEINIEYPVHIPDYEKFKEGYLNHSSEPIIIIQGRPRSWMEDKIRFEEFKKIVLFLKNRNVQFVTPYEYYQIKELKYDSI